VAQNTCNSNLSDYLINVMHLTSTFLFDGYKVYIKTLKLCKNNKPQTTMLFTPFPAAQTLHITLILLYPLTTFQVYTQTNINNTIVATMITSDLGLQFYTTPYASYGIIISTIRGVLPYYSSNFFSSSSHFIIRSS
jgi:hypothetical protein